MTHIHAYYDEVEKAKERVVLAQGELEKAERELQEHPDYVAPKPEPKVETKPASREARV